MKAKQKYDSMPDYYHAEPTKCNHGNEEHICPECEEAEHEKNMKKV